MEIGQIWPGLESYAAFRASARHSAANKGRSARQDNEIQDQGKPVEICSPRGAARRPATPPKSRFDSKPSSIMYPFAHRKVDC